MNVEKLIKETLIEIVEKKYLVRLTCEGFDSWYDMSGQRECTLTKVFNHVPIEEFPMLLGLVRHDYVSFWSGHLETAKFYKEGDDASFYRLKNQKDTIIGQITITEEMVKRGDIALNSEGSGVIKFKHMSLNFRKSV